MTLNWHALYVLTNSERKISDQLEILGFETCVPLQKQLRYWKDRKKLMDVVLFTNYVFIASDPFRLSEPLQVRNVFGYVKFGGKIANLTETEVSLIRTIGQAGNPVKIQGGQVQVGDEVRVVRGPLQNLCGVVVSYGGGNQLQLAIPSLQCFAQVTVSAGDIQRLREMGA